MTCHTRIARTLFCVFVLLFAAAKAGAQYEQAADVFGGYSHLSLKPAESSGESDSFGLPGWSAALTGYAKPWLAFAADVGWNRATVSASTLADSVRLDVSQWSYLFGPQIRALRTQRFAASVRVLVGASRADANLAAVIAGNTTPEFSVKKTKFAAAVGPVFDFNITPRIAWRFQPDLFVTTFAGDDQKNFRVSTGIVFRFGTPW
jgi:hypothetical protein